MTSDLLRISIMGSAPGGERWSINPVWSLLTPDDVSYTDTSAICTAINTMVVPAGLRSALTTSSFVTGARVEARKVTGELQAQSESARPSATAGAGSTGHPPQSAIVVSLRTGFPGGSGRGRMYWPASGLPLTLSTLRVDPTYTPGILTGFKTLATDITAIINTQLGGAAVLAVWSRANNALYAVNRLIVGDVVDTQRRRRDALPEAYQSTTYPV